MLCDLVAGGVPDEGYADKAALLVAQVEPDSAVAAAHVELTKDLLDDLRRVDRQIAESKKRLEQLVTASGSSVVDIFGIGPVGAATVVGITGDIARFRRPTGSPPSMAAPHRGVLRRPQGLVALPPREPDPQPRHPHGRRYRRDGATVPAGATTTARSPKARQPRKRCVPSSEGSAMRSGRPWSQTFAGLLPPAQRRVREGNRGTSLSPARPAHTPKHRLFGSATPEPEPRLRPPSRAGVPRRRGRSGRPEEALDAMKERGLRSP